MATLIVLTGILTRVLAKMGVMQLHIFEDGSHLRELVDEVFDNALVALYEIEEGSIAHSMQNLILRHRSVLSEHPPVEN